MPYYLMAEAQGYAYRWLGALEDVESVEIPPELREACHRVLSRSSDATTAIADTLKTLRRIPAIAAEVEEAECRTVEPLLS